MEQAQMGSFGTDIFELPEATGITFRLMLLDIGGGGKLLFTQRKEYSLENNANSSKRILLQIIYGTGLGG